MDSSYCLEPLEATRSRCVSLPRYVFLQVLHCKLDPAVDPLCHSKFKSIQTQVGIQEHHLKRRRRQQQLTRMKWIHRSWLMGHNKWDKLNRCCRRQCPLSPPQRAPDKYQQFTKNKRTVRIKNNYSIESYRLKGKKKNTKSNINPL